MHPIEYNDEIASCYSELGDDNGKLLLTELSMFHNSHVAISKRNRRGHKC